MISIRTISNRGSRIPEPLLVFTSKCPLKAQISQGLGPFVQIQLLKTGSIVQNSTVRDLEFDETVPLCFSRIYQSILARDKLFEPNDLDEASNRIPPTSQLLRIFTSTLK